MTVGTEEGDLCNRDGCGGMIRFPKVEDCCCHISPPCSACVDNRLTCDACGAEPEDAQ